MGTAYLAGVTFRDRSWRKQVGRRTVTAFALACAGLSGTGAALMAATPAGATTVTSYTWTGASASATLGDWSLPSNWSGGAAPSGSVGTLTFPDLSANSACTTTPSTAACYVSTDNVPGIGASGLDFTQSTGAYFIGSAGGASLGIGSGGISATGATSRDSLNVPLQLTANQVWTVSKSTELMLAGGISAAPGQTPAPTLGVTLSGQSVLGLGGPVETGGFTATGATASDTGNQAYRNGLVAIGNPSVVGDLNGSGAAVAVKDVALFGAGTTGPLTATGGAVMAGNGSKAPGRLAIAGRAAFDSHSVLDLTITQSGTTPGADYSQLDASGTVNLGGVGLQVASGYDAPPTPPATSPTPVCTIPATGTTYTLVSAGTLAGEVTGPTGPVASGGIVPLAFPQGCTNPNEALQLHYNTSSTPSTLTGTVVSASTGLPSPDHTLLVNAASGSDTNKTGTASNDCQATPCATIQHAVRQAETLPGSVQVDIASGTYREQVTIAPGGSSPMTSLTLQGPVLGSPPAVVEPASLVQNVTEGATGNFFDDNTGDTAAIIGVQTGSPDTAAGVAKATSQPVPVTVANLTVSGVNLGGLPPGGELEGIAFVDTSGGIIGNTVEHIEQASAMGQAAVHGIEVKATAGPAAVAVSGNTAKNDAGHVAVDLMSAPGDLTATVTGNTLTGDPVATTTPVAQFGVAAGGLAGLTVAGNTIADFQSPWSVGAVWLDAQSAGAACSVTGNTLVANDNGVDLHGASGCTISGNDISAGSAGVEIGPSYTGSPAVPSSSNSVTNNAITGTTTEASTLSYDGTSTPASAVAGVPVDGVLVWDGSQNTVAGNAVSGFVHDVYAGEDPVYLNNTASWGAGMPASYSGNTVGVSVSDNSLTVPATAVAGSDVTSVGAAELNAPTGTLPMVTTDNWWGSASGPASPGNTYTDPAGDAKTVAVAGNVAFTPWLTTAPALGASGLTGFAPVTDATSHTGYPSIQAAVDGAARGDTIDVAPGTYAEGVTVTKPLTIDGAQAGTDPVTTSPTSGGQSILAGTSAGGSSGSSGFGVQASDVTIAGFTVADPYQDTGAPGYGFGIDVAKNVSGTHIVDNFITGNVAGIYLNGGSATAQTVVEDDVLDANTAPGSASGDGIYSDQGITNALIQGDSFQHIGTDSAGIVLAGPAGTQTGITVADDTFGGPGTGVVLFDTSNASIDDSRITTGSGNDGILIGGGDAGITVQGDLVGPVAAGGAAVHVEKVQGGPNSAVTVRYDSLGRMSTPGGFLRAHVVVAPVGIAVAAGSVTVAPGSVTGAAVNATDNWWGCAGGPNEAGCATTAGSVTTTTWLAALAIAPASQTVASGATATLTATLQDNTGAAVPAPLGVRYTTTPGVGSGVVALATAGAGAGSAVFDVSSAGAGTVDVSAALTFGTDPTAAGAEAAGPSGSATVTFSSPPTASPVSGPPTPPPAPPGSTSSDSGSSDSPTGTATASVGGTTASGIGEGSLTVSQYGSDPAGAPTFASAGEYFDVEVATGSRFSSLTITDCNLNGGTSLQYWTGSSWVAVSPASYSAGPPACVTASLSSSSTPTIAQLTGTVFAVVAPKTAPASSPPSTKAASGAQGYRLVASDGGVFSFGAAAFYGSLGATHLNEPVVATAATPDGKGYWLVASDGGVFAFGDAAYEGSLPAAGVHVSDVVGMAATPDGKGYWLVASDGGVFAFGDAAYHGSLPADGVHVADVVGMAAAPGGTGYWLVGADGGVFAFGGAGYFGSAPGAGAHVADVRAIVAASSGDGYWLAGADGGIFAFGAAGYEGSLPGIGVHVSDVVGLAGMP